MQNYDNELKKQLEELDALILKSDKELFKLKNLPNRGIAVSKSNGYDQYYWVDRDAKKRFYAKNAEREMLMKIAQRDYELAVNEKLTGLRNRLDEFLRKYDISEINKVHTDLSASRRKLISPIIDTDELFVKKWESVSYDGLDFTEDTEFYSNKGVRVRSKSELIIANTLEQMGIPYRYEYPVFLKGFGTVHPDFTCLNIKKRKEFLWEHFGMMDHIAYANKNVAKIHAYNRNGYHAGNNMIMTFETSQQVISSNIIRTVIKQFL